MNTLRTFTAEHKPCANTASVTLTRNINHAPVDIPGVESTFVHAGNGRYVDIHAKPHYW